MTSELLPSGERQAALWGRQTIQTRAWQVMDRINAEHGRGTVRIGSAGPKIAAWNLGSQHRSPRATTCWEELPRVLA